MLPHPLPDAKVDEVARAILKALIDARTARRSLLAIVLDGPTQKGLEAMGLGYWSAGPGTWSLFKVPVVIGSAPGWHLLFGPEALAA